MIVTSYLMGGLGNQMFQISKAVSESLEHGLQPEFLKDAFIPMHGNQPTNYLTNIFRNIKFVDFLPPRLRVSEPTWSYTDLNVNYTTPIEFYGYFQSSKNFKGHRDKIRELFSPTDDFKKKIQSIYPEVFYKRSVSLHVRRGDYLGISDWLPVIDKTYIDKCLEVIGEYDKLFIFSNDKKWCEKNLDYVNSEIISDLYDYEELWMMSLCNINIMSNSSFSWWGSYLNINENKKIYCPSVWFGPKGEKNYQDIYEDNWNKIDVQYVLGKLLC
jgi:hypothetical protein